VTGGLAGDLKSGDAVVDGEEWLMAWCQQCHWWHLHTVSVARDGQMLLQRRWQWRWRGTARYCLVSPSAAMAVAMARDGQMLPRLPVSGDGSGDGEGRPDPEARLPVNVSPSEPRPEG
jgi:hypothetical protein